MTRSFLLRITSEDMSPVDWNTFPFLPERVAEKKPKVPLEFTRLRAKPKAQFPPFLGKETVSRVGKD